MKIFSVEGLFKVLGDNPAWKIINKYLPKEKGFDVEAVRKELFEGGYIEESGSCVFDYEILIKNKLQPIKNLVDHGGKIRDIDAIVAICKTNISTSNYIALLDVEQIIRDKELLVHILLDEPLLLKEFSATQRKEVLDYVMDNFDEDVYISGENTIINEVAVSLIKNHYNLYALFETLSNKQINNIAEILATVFIEEVVENFPKFNPVEHNNLALKFKEHKDSWFGVKI